MAVAAPLLELLQANAKPQRPESFICEGCNTLSSTDVEDKLLRLPEVFVVHINRADRNDRRIDTPVDFPESIDLDTILLSAGCAYLLRSIHGLLVCHNNPSICCLLLGLFGSMCVYV